MLVGLQIQLLDFIVHAFKVLHLFFGEMSIFVPIEILQFVIIIIMINPRLSTATPRLMAVAAPMLRTQPIQGKFDRLK